MVSKACGLYDVWSGRAAVIIVIHSKSVILQMSAVVTSAAIF